MSSQLPLQIEAHDSHSARAKYLERVSAFLNCVPEHERIAAQIIRDAIDSSDDSQESIAIAAGMTAGCRSKVQRWITGECSPGLVHLVRLAASKPSLCEAIARGLLSLCAPTKHMALALPDRVCLVLQALGRVSHEATMALADGVIDDDERRSIRREIQHARDVLSQLERDVDAQMRRST